MSYTDATDTCDLVMKGGITSGVVYPGALLALARRYRFGSIGGTSAGAIAAAFAAAAELARDDGGFERLAEIPGEISGILFELFQPIPEHRKTFDALVGALEKGRVGTGWILWNARRLLRSFRRLPHTGFGLCPGTRQPGFDRPGLSEWLHQRLQYVAGLPLDEPLTFGRLAAAGITLRMIATNLSRQAPVTLPSSHRFWMRSGDAGAVLPEDVVTTMVPDATAPDFLDVPRGDDLPVLLATRMSLSFPVLLTAVPLYDRDWTLRLCPEEQRRRQVCWFSDGGISSNFPIHLFDAALPTRPTFGISLEPYHPCRQGPDEGRPGANRIYLPVHASQGLQRPLHTIGGVLSFLGAVMDSAKNWQDAVQTVLPGYRERIVRLYLKDSEGGLNLAMPPELVEDLGRLGHLAGEAVLDRFDFDEHRWRRLLSASAAVEEAFEQIAAAFDGGFEEFLDRHRQRFAAGETGSYPPKDLARLDELVERWRDLAVMARRWAGQPLRDDWNGAAHPMPRPRASLRFFPSEFVDPDR